MELRSQLGPPRERTREWEARGGQPRRRWTQEAVEIPESSSSEGSSSSGRSPSSCSSHHEHVDQYSVDALIRQAESLGVHVEPLRPDGASRAAPHLVDNLVDTGFCLLPPAGCPATQDAEPGSNLRDELVIQKGENRAWAKRLLSKWKQGNLLPRGGQTQLNPRSATPDQSERRRPSGSANQIPGGWAARLMEKKRAQ